MKRCRQIETDFALSALPPHLRNAATVYLLNPAKGYYIARQGTNGFVCFIARTEWEWAEFRDDVATPISFDKEGAKTVLHVYLDVAAMRASGEHSPAQVKDTIIARAPVMRVYTSNDPHNNNVASVSMPHYMYYAPYLTNADLDIESGSKQEPFLVNPDANTLGRWKGSV